MTLDDLERPKRTLAEKSFYGAYQKNLSENRPSRMERGHPFLYSTPILSAPSLPLLFLGASVLAL